ncbi:MAG TPA: adenylate/guanylate cyclase domain-containing protein [Verrucomicrobiae bacterium]|nr:adenylate/guanylate cyclase domain-containing protein [Verrucomicrobiae bacterium]
MSPVRLCARVLLLLRRRPRFSVALVALVVALTAFTGAAIGLLAWREQRAQSRALADAAMTQAARLVATHTARFLQAAESSARLGPAVVAEGRLDPHDFHAVEAFVLGVLRAHPELTWVSYGDRDDRFVGARRAANGELYINTSFPVGERLERIRLEEDQLLPNGLRVPFRRAEDHGYRPSRRPFFRLAAANRDLTWTEPYEFYSSGGPGLTCAMPLLDAAGAVQGVFTVDFSLARLAEFLDEVEVSPRGRILIAARDGHPLVEQRRRGAQGAPAIPAAALAQVPLERDTRSSVEFQHNGERYLARAVPLPAGGLGWRAEVVVPARDYTARVDAQGRRALVLGALAVLVALGCGVATARWMARPLQDLANLALRIRQGNLDAVVRPRSHDEIGVLTRSMGEMVRALRDREFVRQTLGRYVSPELAERVLRDPDAVRLGGELREVTILMSDLRGFSELSERLGPEAMIDILNRYLATMTQVIQAHGGMINEFIGDAILVLFGAPFQHRDDCERAVRCAWDMQCAMAALNVENRRLGLPELAMGIGIHVGPVVAGNIGSRDRVKYGVVGSPVNLAARIQALAFGGEVLLSESVVERSGHVRVGAPRRVRAKGFASLVTVHPLEGLDGGGHATPLAS